MEIKLGFGAVPKPQYIFVNKEANHCWYRLEEEKQVPIEEKALTGIITNIECNKAVETQYGIAYKTDLTILAPSPHVVRSGRESYFSKSLLLALDALSIEELKKPLTITVEPGDKTVVFCNIYNPSTYQAVNVNWENHQNINLESIERAVSSKINSLNSGTSVSSIKSNQQDELFKQLMDYSSNYINRLEWQPAQGRKYLESKYGVPKRTQLTLEQLLEFTLLLAELSVSTHQAKAA
ncbi:hypothetical protein CAL7716_100240 (plasmid) [Calothrix sp. PCC 7716]|nr:hypothetical protein CAL7716_100240 [Calothrix sp. PCC 7716]